MDYKNWCFLNLEFLKSQTRYAQTVRFLNEILQFENNTIFPPLSLYVFCTPRPNGQVSKTIQSKQKNSRSELLLLRAPHSGGGGVEGIGGSGERKKGSPLPLIPIPRGATVLPKLPKE